MNATGKSNTGPIAPTLWTRYEKLLVKCKQYLQEMDITSKKVDIDIDKFVKNGKIKKQQLNEQQLLWNEESEKNRKKEHYKRCKNGGQ